MVARVPFVQDYITFQEKRLWESEKEVVSFGIEVLVLGNVPAVECYQGCEPTITVMTHRAACLAAQVLGRAGELLSYPAIANVHATSRRQGDPSGPAMNWSFQRQLIHPASCPPYRSTINEDLFDCSLEDPQCHPISSLCLFFSLYRPLLLCHMSNFPCH